MVAVEALARLPDEFREPTATYRSSTPTGGSSIKLSRRWFRTLTHPIKRMIRRR
jgi:hypothetical protein